MVRSSLRRSTVCVAPKRSVVYKPGSVCFVLSTQDCMSLVQFYSLLLKVDRRMKDASKASPDSQANKGHITFSQSRTIRLRKNSFAGHKGSQLSGPLLFLRELLGVVGGYRFIII